MSTEEIVRQALRCANHSCACHKPTGHVHCPAHDPARRDKTPFLSITEKDKILVHCFNGCSQETVIDAMKEKGIWPSANGNDFKKRKVIKSFGKGRNTATVTGLTLEELAKAKGFQIDGPKGLTAWGVAQVVQRGATVIRIPYFNEEGEVVAVRFRHSLGGPLKFTWRKGDKVLPYGLWRLREIQEAG